MELARPDSSTRILDIGVTDGTWRAANFLEASYPWPANITAVSVADVPAFREHFPEVEVVIADGRALPFDDEAFDVGFSNAVIEHVGSREDQRRFVHETLRTCRLVFISTPNAWFPIDPHTLLPFVHWLPRRIRHPILRATRNEVWASEAMLNPISIRTLRGLFPDDVEVRIERQRILGLTTVVTAVARRRGGADSTIANPTRPT
jgi:SAM-dependent methyltransferase